MRAQQTFVTYSEEEDKWKGTKKLGSLLADEEDINRRLFSLNLLKGSGLDQNA